MRIAYYSSRSTGPLALLVLAFAIVSGCGTSAPVQEMSNARQAAREAGAEQFASQNLSQAEILLRKASLGIERGDYNGAREHALAARQAAARARVVALDATTESGVAGWGF
ncbi:MAG: hypothetical protein AMS22_05860 [Thiotrichales bacterium SG8_50]|nr:MAG: hypothetical protein AMS22_05860 [Thiotrichales bacterium SG8_50]